MSYLWSNILISKIGNIQRKKNEVSSMVAGESVVVQDANLVQYLQKLVQIVNIQVVTNTVNPV